MVGTALSGVLYGHFDWRGTAHLGLVHTPAPSWLPLQSVGYQPPELLERAALRDLGQATYGLLLVGVVSALLAFVALQLTQASRRKREWATRAAVGAAPLSLLGLGVRPALRAAGLGSLLGTMLALLATWWVQRSWPGVMADGSGLRAARVLVGVSSFSVASIGLTVLGLWLFTLRGALAGALSAGERASADQSETRLREVILLLQVAASVVLLTAAAWLAHASEQRRQVRPTLRDLQVARMTVEEGAAAGARVAALRRLLSQWREAPGIQAESLASAGALAGQGASDVVYSECDICVSFLGRIPFTVLSPRLHAVGPAFFRTIGQEVLQGREFNAADSAGAPRVAMVSRAFALEVFATERAALGRHVRLQAGKGPPHRIIGVVADRAGVGLGSPSARTPALYFAALQYPPVEVDLIVRGDAGLPNWERMQAAVVAPIGFMSRGINALAVLCFLLTIVGVTVVIAALAASARPELAVRHMIGAPPGSLRTLLIVRYTRISAAGAAVGALGGFAALRLLQMAIG